MNAVATLKSLAGIVQQVKHAAVAAAGNHRHALVPDVAIKHVFAFHSQQCRHGEAGHGQAGKQDQRLAARDGDDFSAVALLGDEREAAWMKAFGDINGDVGAMSEG